MKQTAVELLIDQLTPSISLQQKHIDELKEKAKEMEKEQMSRIYEGLLQNVGTSIKQCDLPTFEQYYKETFGGNK